VQLGTRGVEEHRAVAHGRELLGADHPDGVIGDRRVQRDDVRLGQQLVEAVFGLDVIGIVGDDTHAQAGQPPLQSAADGAEADQPGREPGDLPAAESLIRDDSVAKSVAAANI
jgi:hypothetical protein